MQKIILSSISAALLLALSGCGDSAVSSPTIQTQTSLPASAKNSIENNPLLQEFKGPYGGVPAFDKMELANIKPAFDIAMAENLAEIDKITANSDTPTFENTIAALESAGKKLSRVSTYYGIWRSNASRPEFRKIQQELAPTLSAFRSKITQNDALFKRVEAVYKGGDFNTLNKEQQRVTWLTYNSFARNGATLTSQAKQRYGEINQELAVLHTQFANNVLADEENYVVFLTKDQLGGLPEAFIKTAAKAASERGKEGAYAITNTRSSMTPFLTYSTERALREQVWKNYYNRGGNGDEFDNHELIKQILTLRHERVQLLGYQNYAAWRLEDRMAKTPENAMALMNKVWPKATARVNEEVAAMQAMANELGDKLTIEPWDYLYYSEKVRKAKYDLDSNEVKQYLELNKLREAMFYVAGRLFNFEFTRVADGVVPVFHPDVEVWQVTDKTTKKHIGLWYLDAFARKGKRSGAWATTYRSYTTFEGEQSVLSSNNSNFVKGASDEKTLISWSDAETFFHEFGHALHFLSAKVAYPMSHSGVRDYTEFQSQLLERWILTDEVINNYLVHSQTGEPMPKALIDKIKRAANFNQGFKTTEYLASAIMDMLYHTTDPATIDPKQFERSELERLGMPKELVMRHRSTHFGHIFSGEGYSAGYYGYLWAEVLTSDAAEAFTQAPGGFYDKALAQKLVDHLFSVRNAIDPQEAYRLFRGRDAEVEALMRDRGFAN